MPDRSLCCALCHAAAAPAPLLLPSATLKHKRKLIFPLLCFRIAVCVLCASQRSAKLPKIFSVLYIGINYVRVFLCVCVRLCVCVCVCLCVYNWVLLRLCVVCIVLTLLLELICSSNTSKGSPKGSPLAACGDYLSRAWVRNWLRGFFGAQELMASTSCLQLLPLLCSSVI